MTATTIIIAALSAASAAFAALFLKGRGDASRYESKADAAARELSDLRCEMARMEARGSEALTPLNRNTLTDFLKKEHTTDVEVIDEDNVVFGISDEKYHFQCSRLPHQLILRKGYNLSADAVHWDIAEKAARDVSDSLVMVKMHVIPEDSYDLMIVSTDRTVRSLRENFSSYMSIIADAEKMFRERYWSYMEVEHPEECMDDEEEEEDEEDVLPTMDEKAAVRTLIESAHPSKVQS